MICLSKDRDYRVPIDSPMLQILIMFSSTHNGLATDFSPFCIATMIWAILGSALRLQKSESGTLWPEIA
jgi:hypothetical protein